MGLYTLCQDLFWLYTRLYAVGWVLTYVYGSIGLVSLARKKGVPHAWFGAVPVLRLSVLGRLKPESSVGPVIIHRSDIVLPMTALLIIAVAKLSISHPAEAVFPLLRFADNSFSIPWLAEIIFPFFWYAVCKAGFAVFREADFKHPKGSAVGSFFFPPVFYCLLYKASRARLD